MGFSLKRIFSNPAKSLGDVASFGISFVGREVVPKSLGGGQSGFFSKTSETLGATLEGTAIGFATGGTAGAVVGGATGFGRGVAGVLNKDSGSKIAGGAAKWSAITGATTGFINGAPAYAAPADGAIGPAAKTTLAQQFQSGGVAGIVRNAILPGTTKAPKITLPKISGFTAATTGAASLITALKPSFGKVADFLTATPPVAPNIITPPTTPGILETVGPSQTPEVTPTTIVNGGGQADASSSWLWVLALVLTFVILKRKKR